MYGYVILYVCKAVVFFFCFTQIRLKTFMRFSCALFVPVLATVFHYLLELDELQ